MVFTQKLSTLAYDLAEVKWTKKISFKNFVTYSLFFPGLILSPCVYYREFESFVDHSLYGKVKPLEFKELQSKLAKRLFVEGLFFVLFYSVYSSIVSVSFFTSDSFKNLSWYKKLGLVCLNGFGGRARFYCAWLITEAHFIRAGAGFRLLDDGKSFGLRKMKNISIWEWETSVDFRGKIKHWNIRTTEWLSEYIFKRSSKIGYKANLYTFIVSAMWHVNPFT